MASVRVHGVCVALAPSLEGPLAGVLLLGPSGAGKSDLALRLLDSCPYQRARLVADDQVDLRTEADDMIASAPPALPPWLEVRGVGLLEMVLEARVTLVAAFDLSASPRRLPEPAHRTFEGLSGARLPVFALNPFEASAPAKIRASVAALLGGLLRHNDDDDARS
ncbi:MAG: aldolase [Pseudomonadota bacterium]